MHIMQINILALPIFYMKFKSLERLITAVQEIICSHTRVKYHITIVSNHRNLFNDVVSKRADGVVA